MGLFFVFTAASLPLLVVTVRSSALATHLTLLADERVFRKSEVVFIGLGISFFLHAFLQPLYTKVPSLGLFIKLLPLVPIPPVIDAVAGIWFAVVGSQIIQEVDDGRRDKLLQDQRPLRWIDVAGSAFGISVIIVFHLWGRQQFLLARNELGPAILSRHRALETESQLFAPASDGGFAAPHDGAIRLSRVSQLPTVTSISPPPPLPTADSVRPNSPQSLLHQPSIHLEHQSPMDTLVRLEWQLRGGTVKMIRDIMGWVTGVGVACLACDVAFTILVEVSGNSLLSYYSWLAQALVK
ncbi:hypothetical protein DFJ73DRAFT_914045 [Zopfochytrium polystomum]|nr:hypothetical protein DFJ73DRAFT_914045 [Zopfochytrium polystomum]